MGIADDINPAKYIKATDVERDDVVC